MNVIVLILAYVLVAGLVAIILVRPDHRDSPPDKEDDQCS